MFKEILGRSKGFHGDSRGVTEVSRVFYDVPSDFRDLRGIQEVSQRLLRCFRGFKRL